MVSTVPYCNGQCGLQIDADERPWLALIGYPTERIEPHGGQLSLLCPDCEADKLASLAEMAERLHHVQTVRLPDHRFDTVMSVFADPFTIGETAEALKVDVGELWWLIKGGRCPVLREGRKVRIPVWWVEMGDHGELTAN